MRQDGCEKRLNRNDCIAIVERMGWPTPPRSSCWMCPNHNHDEWQWIKKNAPEDFKKAADFEQQIRIIDPDLWLSDTGKLITESDYSHPDDLLSFCKSGECFV